jgi:predicted secreted protein
MRFTRFSARPALLALALITASSTAALAHDDRGTVGHPDGTILNIAATERTQVAQDLLMASLRIDHEAADAAAVQAHINSVMQKALEQSKSVKGVDVSTGGYHVYQYQDGPIPRDGAQNTKPVIRWRGSQSLELQSTESAALLKLVGALQESGLVMNNLSYALSPAAADAAKDSLMEKALEKVQARAARAAKALGQVDTKLLELNVDTSDTSIPQYPMMRGMAMEAAAKSMDAPSAEPGTSDITLTIHARVLLKE